MRVEKTENSLRLAIDGDQGVNEKTRRNPIASRSKPATIGLPAGEIDLGGVLRDDNPPARVPPSLRITSDPVAATRCISSVPLAARRASPK